MDPLTPWRLQAEIQWVTVGGIAPMSWAAMPLLRASIVFADRARGELFSASGTATARIRPHDPAVPASCAVEVLLPSALLGYVAEGTQFLVTAGPRCAGVGAITDAGGPGTFRTSDHPVLRSVTPSRDA